MRSTRSIALAFVLSFVFALALPQPAMAEERIHQGAVYRAITVEEMSSLLRTMGFSFEMTTTARGTPVFSFQLQGYNVNLLLYGCEDSVCKSLALYTAFHLKKGPTIEVVNEWNKAKRFSRAYLDSDNDPVLEADLDLEGGTSLDSMSEFILTFRTSVQAYARHIGFGA